MIKFITVTNDKGEVVEILQDYKIERVKVVRLPADWDKRDNDACDALIIFQLQNGENLQEHYSSTRHLNHRIKQISKLLIPSFQDITYS